MGCWESDQGECLLRLFGRLSPHDLSLHQPCPRADGLTLSWTPNLLIMTTHTHTHTHTCTQHASNCLPTFTRFLLSLKLNDARRKAAVQSASEYRSTFLDGESVCGHTKSEILVCWRNREAGSPFEILREAGITSEGGESRRVQSASLISRRGEDRCIIAHRWIESRMQSIYERDRYMISHAQGHGSAVSNSIEYR